MAATQEIEKLVGDSKLYKDTIVDLIRSSAEPNYTIGIYGDWGTGKTELMAEAYKEIHDKSTKNIISVWFNAWQYEREQEFALIPLLKTMANAVEKKPEHTELSNLLKRLGLSLLRSSSDVVSLILPGFLSDTLKKIIVDASGNVTDQFIESYEKILETVSDARYYEGLEEIKEKIENIRKMNSEFRIVVFIDDLDRCSPSKMLEVFESTKVFLNIPGFIFVIGISYNVIVERIEKTEDLEDGNEYLKKIVDIPVFLPSWNDETLDKLIDLSSMKELPQEERKGYLSIGDLKELVKEKDVKKLIKEIAESNPREIKRFIRNLIFSFGIMAGFIQKYSDKGILRNTKAQKILMIFVTLQGMNFKWNELYNLILYTNETKRQKFLNDVKLYSKHRTYYTLSRTFTKDASKKKVKRIIKKHDKEDDFKNFLKNYHEILISISPDQWSDLQAILKSSSYSYPLADDNILPQASENTKSRSQRAKDWFRRNILRMKESKNK